MNKRSAMIVAAGLIVALVAGAYALALGVTGPVTQAQAKTTAQTSGRTKTVTVHKKAPSSHGGAAMSAPMPGSGGGGGSYYSAPTSSGRTYTSGGGSQEDGGSSTPPPTGTGTPPPEPGDN
jgi:hypothetical protein